METIIQNFLANYEEELGAFIGEFLGLLVLSLPFLALIPTDSFDSSSNHSCDNSSDDKENYEDFTNKLCKNLTKKTGDEFYDGKGWIRKPGEEYYDSKGWLRKPGEEFYDGKGWLRKTGEEFYDGDGWLRKPSDEYYDGKGWKRKP